MSQYQLVFCYNSQEQRFFLVDSVFLVEDPYSNNCYRLRLRLNFFEGDVDFDHTEGMMKLCLEKITNLMTTYKLWQNNHSFYVVQYEVRRIVRKNDLIQQNLNREDEDSSDDESVSSANSQHCSSVDSAYSSASSVDSFDYWGNRFIANHEDETLTDNESLSE